MWPRYLNIDIYYRTTSNLTDVSNYSELAAGADGVLTRALAEFERTLIGAALEHSGGHKGDAARRLGYGRNTLTRKLSRLGLPADCRPRKGREG